METYPLRRGFHRAWLHRLIGLKHPKLKGRAVCIEAIHQVVSDRLHDEVKVAGSPIGVGPEACVNLI